MKIIDRSNHLQLIHLMTMLLVFLCVIAEMTAVTAPEGTVDPSTTAVTWSGTAIGTGGTDETGAIEGVNRDTFVLHVTAGDYTGKVIAVKIAWSSGRSEERRVGKEC